MENQTIYGAFLIAYILPYWVWTIARDQKIEILKEFYPGRADENAIKRRGNQLDVIWTAGLAILLIGWSLDWHPIPTFAALLLLWAIFGITRRAPKFQKLLELRRTRSAIAAAAVWFAFVLGWYIIFGSRYGFEPRDALLLALIPILIALLALLAYVWVRKGKP